MHLVDGRGQSLSSADSVLGSLFEGGSVLALHSGDLNLLLGYLLAQELDSLSFALVLIASTTVLVDLQIQFIELSLRGSLSSSLVLEFGLELSDLCLERPLLPIERLDLLSQLFFVGAGDV